MGRGNEQASTEEGNQESLAPANHAGEASKWQDKEQDVETWWLFALCEDNLSTNRYASGKKEYCIGSAIVCRALARHQGLQRDVPAWLQAGVWR